MNHDRVAASAQAQDPTAKTALTAAPHPKIDEVSPARAWHGYDHSYDPSVRGHHTG